MRHPFVLPSGWLQTYDLVGYPGTPPAGGILPGQWNASRLVRAISDGSFPKPLPIPDFHPLVGWPRQTVIEWIANNS